MKKLILALLVIATVTGCSKEVIQEPQAVCTDSIYVAKYSLDMFFSRNISTIEMTVLLDQPGVVVTQVLNGVNKNTHKYVDSLDITNAIEGVNPEDQLIQFQWKITDKTDGSYLVTKSYNTRKPVDKAWWGHPVVLSGYYGLNQSNIGVEVKYWTHRKDNHEFAIKNTHSAISVIEYAYNNNTNQVTLQPGDSIYFTTGDEHFNFTAANITLYPDPDERIEFTDRLSVHNMVLNEVLVRIEKQAKCNTPIKK